MGHIGRKRQCPHWRRDLNAPVGSCSQLLLLWPQQLFYIDLIPLLSHRRTALRIWVVCSPDMVHLTPTVDACGEFLKEPRPKFDWKLVWFSLIDTASIFPSPDIVSRALPWRNVLRNHWKTSFDEIKTENWGSMWLNILTSEKLNVSENAIGLH